MKKFLFLAFSVCLMIYSCSSQQKSDQMLKVTIADGVLQGMKDSVTGVYQFLGIPFAKPPVGNLRWKAPQPVNHWKGIRKADHFGPRPMQPGIFSDMHFRSDSMSEDCLYLNVWTPAQRNVKGLPVLLYFYGGGFIAGSSDEPRYDGASLAKKGIVVVTANYRLNVFGFFASPELSAEAPYKASGNYGLLDQQAALKWVHQNIAAFGGDPQKITIGGESAGSISVSEQMASPLSKGLIAGAIGESGAAFYPTMAPVSLSDAEKVGETFAHQIGYSSLKALRSLTAHQLLNLYVQSNYFNFPACIDGYFLPKSMSDIYRAKEQAQVPLLVGWNSAEMPAVAFMEGKSFSPQNFIAQVKKAFPKDYNQVLKAYPHANAIEVEHSATDLASDRFIVFSTWKWFDLQRNNSNQSVYRYLFDNTRPPLVNATSGSANGQTKKSGKQNHLPQPIGAAHSQEIEYCLGNLYLTPWYAWRKQDYAVSDTMSNYFANFIKTGNPNGKALPDWPAAAPHISNPFVMWIKPNSKAIRASNDQRFFVLEKFFDQTLTK
ncbi:MAG: carboxylesterase/lipase family protein [Microbacter sp.]